MNNELTCVLRGLFGRSDLSCTLDILIAVKICHQRVLLQILGDLVLATCVRSLSELDADRLSVVITDILGRRVLDYLRRNDYILTGNIVLERGIDWSCSIFNICAVVEGERATGLYKWLYLGNVVVSSFKICNRENGA